MDTPIAVALIGALAGIFATAGGWIATAKAGRAERRTKAVEQELAEKARIQSRWEHLVDELQQDNDRLRTALRECEKRPRR